MGFLIVPLNPKTQRLVRWAQQDAKNRGMSLTGVLFEALLTYRVIRGVESVRGKQIRKRQIRPNPSQPDMRWVEALPKNQPIDAAYVQETFGVSRGAAKMRLRRMAQRGVLRRVERGKYVVVGGAGKE